MRPTSPAWVSGPAAATWGSSLVGPPLGALFLSGCGSFNANLARGLSNALFGAAMLVAGAVGAGALLGQVLARRRRVGAAGLVFAWVVALGALAASAVATQRFNPHPGTLGRTLWLVWLVAPAVLNAPLLTARFVAQRTGRSLRTMLVISAAPALMYLAILARASIVAQPPAFDGRIVELAITNAHAYVRTEDGRVFTLEPTYELPGRYRLLRGDAPAAIVIDDAGKAFVLCGRDAPEPLPLPGSAVAAAAGPAFQCLVAHTGALACLEQQDPPAGEATARTWHERWPKVDPSFSEVEQVAASEQLVCALERGGRVRCRAGGFEGAGNVLFHEAHGAGTGEQRSGLFEPRDAPDVVLVESGALGVAVTRGAVCVLVASGRVRCAGESEYGELGPVAREEGGVWKRGRRVTGGIALVEIPGLAEIEQVVAGNFHVCARTRDGFVYCWGGNGCGQLGVEGPAVRPTPARVELPRPARELVGSTCARLGDGTIWCWGGQRASAELCSAKPLVLASPRTYVPLR